MAKNTHDIRDFHLVSHEHNLSPFSYAVSQDPRDFQKNLILSRENRTLLVEFSWGGIFFLIRMPSCLIGRLVYNAFLKFVFGLNLASPVIDLAFFNRGYLLNENRYYTAGI